MGILSGALCRYPRGFRTGEFRVNFWKSCKITAQVVNIHTCEDKTHGLLLTNSPSPVNRVKGMPPIGKADHDIVNVEYDIKAIKGYSTNPVKDFPHQTSRHEWSS